MSKFIKTISAIFICILLIILIFLFLKSKTAEQNPPRESPPVITPSPEPTPLYMPISQRVLSLRDLNMDVIGEKETRDGMVGRLLIPDADINVALFSECPDDDIETARQAICDAQDSAVIYEDREGTVIADHNNQAFATLTQATAGNVAYILRGDIIQELMCSIVADGHNDYHNGLLDENNQPINDFADYICYTCMDNWLNIRLVGLNIIDEYTLDELSLGYKTILPE